MGYLCPGAIVSHLPDATARQKSITWTRLIQLNPIPALVREDIEGWILPCLPAVGQPAQPGLNITQSPGAVSCRSSWVKISPLRLSPLL